MRSAGTKSARRLQSAAQLIPNQGSPSFTSLAEWHHNLGETAVGRRPIWTTPLHPQLYAPRRIQFSTRANLARVIRDVYIAADFCKWLEVDASSLTLRRPSNVRESDS